MKTVLFLSTSPVPDPGHGGPGAVIQRLSGGINKQSEQLGWKATWLSKPPIKATTVRYSLIQFIGTLSRRLSTIEQYVTTRISGKTMYWKAVQLSFQAYQKHLSNNREAIEAADIIHAHDIFAMTELQKQKLVEKPCFLSIHSSRATSRKFMGELKKGPQWLKADLRNMEVSAIRGATALIVPSRAALLALKNDLKEIEHEISAKGFVVYNGIRPIPKRAKTGKILHELELSDDAFLALAVGRLVRDKGFDLLIRAISLISTELRPNFHLVIVGEGPLKNYLRELAHSLKLKSNVHLLGFREDLPDLFAEAHVFVSPSRLSSFDLTILEAMSAGIPIIATNTGGNTEAINENVGILVEPNNPQTIANALISLRKNPQNRIRLGMQAQASFQKRFTLENMVKSYISIYEKFLRPSAESNRNIQENT